MFIKSLMNIRTNKVIIVHAIITLFFSCLFTRPVRFIVSIS